MKINQISNNMDQVGNLESSGSKQKQEKNVDGQILEKGNQAGTKVDISSTSVEYSRAAEKMDEVPEERAKRLEELKVMVKNDTYNVDSKKIAEKIVNDSLENIT